MVSLKRSVLGGLAAMALLLTALWALCYAWPESRHYRPDGPRTIRPRPFDLHQELHRLELENKALDELRRQRLAQERGR